MESRSGTVTWRSLLDQSPDEAEAVYERHFAAQHAPAVNELSKKRAIKTSCWISQGRSAQNTPQRIPEEHSKPPHLSEVQESSNVSHNSDRGSIGSSLVVPRACRAVCHGQAGRRMRKRTCAETKAVRGLATRGLRSGCLPNPARCVT